MLNLNSTLLTVWKIFWRIMLFFLVWGILISLFIVPFSSQLTKWRQVNPLQVQLYSDIVSAITILAASWIMLRFIDHRPLKSLGFSFTHFFRDLLTGLAIGIAWVTIAIFIAWIFGWASPIAPVGFSWTILYGLSISMLFNVLAQELLLCGFVLQTIRRYSNTFIAVLLSSVLFTSYHAGAFQDQWLPVVNVFAAGILFCFAYVITNNLWFPVFIHFAWNILLGPVFGLTESGKTDLGGGWKLFELKGPQLFTGGPFGLEGGLIVTFTIILIISLLYYSRPQIMIDK